MLTSGLEAGTQKRPYAARLPAPQRREQLLDAALSVALERGFHAVTVDGVAKAAGVTRPVVYGLFADRGALLAGLADRAERRALEQLAAVLPDVPAEPDADDPDALLVRGLTAYLTAIRDDPDNWRVILLPPEGAPVEMQQRITGHRRLVLDQLRDLCAWGLARRGGPALDVDLFARSVLTLAEGAARLLLVDPGRWSVEAFSDFARTALAGLAPTVAPSGPPSVAPSVAPPGAPPVQEDR
jgi:AcrR family transcriptional regulator